MEILLSNVEARIVGCLIEKERTTPDYYPMSLNSLTNACNQKSNRDPVLSLVDTSVVRGLDSLQDKGLTEKIFKSDSRVAKYRHLFDRKLELSRKEVAVLCLLMLRGPQTVGEVRGRSERIFKFDDLKEVEDVFEDLMNKEVPMVIKLPRQAGRKERRYMHLLSGEPEIKEDEVSAPVEAATKLVRAENERIEKLENDLTLLRKEFDDFKKDFFDLKSQFE